MRPPDEEIRGFVAEWIAKTGEADWLSPFGADIRYPGDRPETAPGDEVRAHDLARKVRDAVSAALVPYLSRP